MPSSPWWPSRASSYLSTFLLYIVIQFPLSCSQYGVSFAPHLPPRWSCSITPNLFLHKPANWISQPLYHAPWYSYLPSDHFSITLFNCPWNHPAVELTNNLRYPDLNVLRVDLYGWNKGVAYLISPRRKLKSCFAVAVAASSLIRAHQNKTSFLVGWFDGWWVMSVSTAETAVQSQRQIIIKTEGFPSGCVFNFWTSLLAHLFNISSYTIPREQVKHLNRRTSLKDYL